MRSSPKASKIIPSFWEYRKIEWRGGEKGDDFELKYF